jgi:nitrogen fixation/metabolism regulation signal transduction histidine kinase
MSDKAAGPNPRHKRYFKNYLLDKHFQLKYAGYMVGIASLLSLVLGFFLWNTSQSLVEQSREAVSQGQHAVQLGQKVAAESDKVNEVVKMNIVKDPFYADNPELLAAFEEESKKEDAGRLEQQKRLEQQAASLEHQSGNIEVQQRTLLTTLFVALLLLVVGVGMIGIVVTHKVAGPIFKMTRQMTALGEGNWNIPRPLRKGDELIDFFESYRTMVQAMRTKREAQVTALEDIIAAVPDDEDVTKLQDLRDDLARVLDRNTRV